MINTIRTDTDSIEIRQATTDDVVGIVYVQATTWLSCYPSEEYDITEEDIRQIDWQGKIPVWKHMIMSPEYSVWVAAQKRTIHGFVGTFDQKDKVTIDTLYVLPERQGQGLGAKLLDVALKEAAGHSVVLHVAKYNQAAQNLYLKNGFKLSDKTGVFVLPNGKNIPTLQMDLSADVPKSGRQMVTRKQLSHLSGVRESTIKWYSETGLLRYQQADTGLRKYFEPDESIRRLEYIQKLQDQGYSLDQIKDQLIENF